MRRLPLASLIGVGLLAACDSAPPYQPPKVELPAHWSQAGVAGSVPSAVADPALDALVARALQANLDLRLAQSRLREARAQARSAAASSSLMLGLGGSAMGEKESRNAQNPVRVDPEGRVETPGSVDSVFQAGFDARWELDLFGRNRHVAEAAQGDLDSVALDRAAVSVSLIAEVSRVYIELREAQQLDRLDREAVAGWRDSARLVQARFEAGMAAQAETLQSENAERRAEMALPADEAAIRTAISRLSLLVDEPAESLRTELSTAGPIPAPAALPPLALPSDFLRRRPDIRAAERRISAATARLDLARADFFPRISLLGTAGLSSTAAGDFFNPASTLWSIGPSISWPIFDGGKVAAEIEIRDAQLEQELIGYRKAILGGIQEVEAALAEYRRDAALLERQKSLAGLQQDTEALAQARYSAGLADFRGALAAQGETLTARRELIHGEAMVAIDLVALSKALGGGWAEQPR